MKKVVTYLTRDFKAAPQAQAYYLFIRWLDEKGQLVREGFGLAAEVEPRAKPKAEEKNDRAAKFSDEQPRDERGQFASEGDGGGGGSSAEHLSKLQAKVKEAEGRLMDGFVPSRQPRLSEERRANQAMINQLQQDPGTRLSALEQVGLVAAGANTSLGVSRQARGYIHLIAREMGVYGVDIRRNPNAHALMEANDELRQAQREA